MINDFLRMEKEFQLLDEVIDGFRYWPYIRRTIYNYAAFNQDETSSNEQLKGLNISKIVSILKNITVHNPVFYKKQKQILFISHARRQCVEGKYKCIYTDDIADCFADNSVTAEFIYNMGHFQPVHTPKQIYLDAVDIIPAIKYKYLIRKNASTIHKIEKTAEWLSGILSNEIGYSFSVSFIKNLIVKRFIWHKEKKKMLAKIIKNINPKVIVEVVSYEVNKMIVNEIASELGICTIELQHGPIVEGKLAYHYITDNNYDFLPDKLFVFSEYWKDHCFLPIGKNNIIATGYPFMEEQRKKFAPQVNTDGIPRIIVLSQPIISEELLSFIEKCLAALQKEAKEYKIIYKLHPAEYQNFQHFEQKLKKYKNVNIVASNEHGLYELFSNSDVQIGVYSTAIYEGLSYNLKTWIYPAPGADIRGFMGSLLDDGYAELICTEADFVEKVNTWCKKELEFDDCSKKSFFISSSKENICNEIKTILGNSGSTC